MGGLVSPTVAPRTNVKPAVVMNPGSSITGLTNVIGNNGPGILVPSRNNARPTVTNPNAPRGMQLTPGAKITGSTYAGNQGPGLVYTGDSTFINGASYGVPYQSTTGTLSYYTVYDPYTD